MRIGGQVFEDEGMNGLGEKVEVSRSERNGFLSGGKATYE